MLSRIINSQVDNRDEIAQELNKIIDEVNGIADNAILTDAKVCQLDRQMREKPTRSWVKKLLIPKSKKKGSVLMKTIVSMVILVLLCTVCIGQDQWPITYSTCSTPDQLVQLLTNRFSNQSGNYFTFGPTTTAPGHSAGRVYYHTVNGLYVSDGTTWDAIDTAGGLSLDGAYDIGNTITVDGSAVTLTAGASTNNGVLTLVQSNTGAYEGLKITNAGTDPSIEIDGSGTGDDITGTGDTWTISEAGAGTFVGISIGNGDIALTEPGNDVGIRADESDQIEFFNASENVSLGFATSDTLEWHTDSSIATVSWGDLDVHTGLTDITGDATDFTISHTGSGTGADLLITQSGSGDNALTLTSGGTATDAIGLVSAAGITMTSTVEASAWTQTATGTDDDLTIALAGALDASLILSSAGTGADALSIFTSHANGDIKILSTDTIDIDAANGIAIDITGTSGEDYVLTNTGGSIVLSATEDAADAINIDATAGGIDIDAVGEAGQDIVITNTGGSINLVQTEAVDDGLNIDTTGGIDVDSTLAIVLTSAEDTVDSIVLQSATGGIDILCDAGAAGDDIDIANTGGSVNITSSEATDGAIKLQTSNAAGQILLVTADTTSDAIEIDNSGGLEIDCVDVIAIDNSGSTKDITITSALGRVVVTGTESANSAVEIVAGGTAGGVTIDAKTSGITLTATGGDVTVTNTTAKDIIIDAQAGRVLITGTEDAADSILFTADGAGGEIAMTAKTGGIDIDAVGGTINLDVSGAGIDILLDATEGAVSIDGGQTGADAVVIDASHSGGGIDMDYGTGGFSLVGGSGDMVLTLAGAAGDVFTLTNTTGTGAGAIELTSTAGSIDMNAKETILIDLDTGTAGTSDIRITNADGTDAGAIELTATSGGIDLNGNASNDIALNAGQILIESEENTAAAVQLLTNTGVSETILITNTLGTGAGSIALAAMAGGITATVEDGKDIKLSNEGADTYIIVATSGTAGNEDIRLVSVGTDAATIDFVASAGGIRATVADEKDLLFRGADDGASIVIATTNTAGNEDIRITNTNGTDNAAIELTATAGGITAKAADGKLITLSDSDGATYFRVAPHGTASTEILSIINGKGTAAGSIVITSSAGGIDINGGAGGDITIDTSKSLVVTTTEAAASQIVLDATGAASGTALQISTTDGAILLDADGATYGDILMETVDDVQMTIGGHFRIVDDDYMSFGTDDDVTLKYDEATSGEEDNLQIRGPVEFDTTYLKFDKIPTFSSWGSNSTPVWGGAATGTAGDENVMMFPEATFIYHILGDNTAELGPQMRAGGFDISFEDVANEGVEIVGAEPIVGGGKDNFTIGTDAFYLKVRIYLTDADGSDDLFIGFRKVEAFQTAVNAYDTYAMIGVQVADFFTETEENDSGSETSTDIDPTNWANTAAHTLEIYVSAAKAVTYMVDGVTPGNAAAFTWTDLDTVVPFLFFLHHTEVSELTYLVSWECGLQ